MKTACTVAMLCSVALLIARPREKTNAESAVLQDFKKRITDYVSLRKSCKSRVHGPRTSNSPEAIKQDQHELADAIRAARSTAQAGDVFSPPIAAEFRKLIAVTMQSSEAERIRRSLQRAAPVSPMVLRPNQDYASGVPLQSTPPSLLLNLPKLPPEVEYRVVGHSLVLRDAEANLIVDFVANAIP